MKKKGLFSKLSQSDKLTLYKRFCEILFGCVKQPFKRHGVA